MKIFTIRSLSGVVAFFLAIGLTVTVRAQTETLRIAEYNIEADTPGIEDPGYTTPRPGLIQPADGSGNYTGSTTDGGVLEGIGQLPLGANNNVQPLDILALEETTSNTTTVDPIVAGLNSYYSSPGMYARSSVQATQSGSDDFGNGPNAIVYNTHTVQLVASVGIVTPHGITNGVYRQVMRYEFAPAGQTPSASNEFYVYVSHYKASDTTTDANSRNQEAQIIRANSATLPSNSRILYLGDYNINGSSDDSYQTIVASGTNQGVDPLNPSGATGISWTGNSLLSAKTETATSLSVRDDLQIMTGNVFNDTPGGLSLVPNTYGAFGNNGTTPYHTSTNQSGNTSLNGVVADDGSFISAATLKNDLTWASDHLPVVADYTIPVPEPSSLVLLALGSAFLALRGGRSLRKRV